MKTKTYHSELKTALEADLHFDTTVMAGALAEWDQLQSQHAELLAAAKNMIANLQDSDQDRYPEESDQAGEEYDDVKALNAAIAKAEGNQ